MNQRRDLTHVRTPQVCPRAPPVPSFLISKSNQHCFRENGIISSHLSGWTRVLRLLWRNQTAQTPRKADKGRAMSYIASTVSGSLQFSSDVWYKYIEL